MYIGIFLSWCVQGSSSFLWKSQYSFIPFLFYYFSATSITYRTSLDFTLPCHINFILIGINMQLLKWTLDNIFIEYCIQMFFSFFLKKVYKQPCFLLPHCSVRIGLINIFINNTYTCDNTSLTVHHIYYCTSKSSAKCFCNLFRYSRISHNMPLE